MTDNAIKDQVKEATDIVAIVSQYVTLKQRGANYTGLCPFHTEKTPSFSVHGDRQFFHCFGCGKGGDVFTFLMEHEGWTFPEALKFCADRAGIQLPERRSADGDRSARRRQAILDALQMANEIFQRALYGSSGKTALAYLTRRGFQEATLRKGGVGYAPASFETLTRAARTRGLHEKALIAAGLAVESKRDERPYDRFRNRITFPIQNLSGKTIAFGARALSDEDQPKYLNSPETDVYHKGTVLYGLAVARDAIRQARSALVVEGYMDWLTMAEFGINNVVAVSGTALTEQQTALLARFCDRITLVFDSDSAGQRAALRGIDVAFNAGLAVSVAVLPPGDDPDSFLRREGAEKFQALIDKVPGIVEYRIEQARLQAGTLDFISREKLAKEFVELGARISDATRRDAFLSEVAGALRIPMERLRQTRSSATEPGRPPRKRTQTPSASLLKEEEFLRILMEDSGYLEEARSLVSATDFENPLHRRMFSTLMERTAGGIRVTTPDELGPEPDEVEAWARLLTYTVDPSVAGRVFHDVLQRLGERRLKTRLLEIKQLIAQAEREGDAGKINSLIAERQSLQREHRE